MKNSAIHNKWLSTNSISYFNFVLDPQNEDSILA
jgi:hypothetical protein